MRMICLGSGSKGNGYILKASSGESLIIEAGIAMIDFKKALNFNLRNVVGCLVSHAHNDHSKYMGEVVETGITTLALKDVFEAKGIRDGVFCKVIKPSHGYIVGGFKVFTLSVAHDVPCLGFVIEHREMGKILFITDTMMVEYLVSGLSHIMLECNYSDEILNYNIKNGITPSGMRDRLLHSHMELKTATDYLRKCDLSGVNKIILIHLSGKNSDGGEFMAHIGRETGKPVYVARRGFEINLDKEPY